MNEDRLNKQNILKPGRQKLKIFKITGYILLLTCCLLFLSIPVVPWLGFSKVNMVKVTTILFIAGEITFYLSVFLLGKSFFDKIKNKLKFRKTKADVSDFTELTNKTNPG